MLHVNTFIFTYRLTHGNAKCTSFPNKNNTIVLLFLVNILINILNDINYKQIQDNCFVGTKYSMFISSILLKKLPT